VTLLAGNIGTGEAPFRIVAGEGVRFLLDDGRHVLDASNTGCPLGHRHPALVDAVRRAAELPVVSEGWPWHERDDAASDLVDLTFDGEPWVGAVRFCLSGSEANDLALSLAQALTGREVVATRERAYHGMVGLARAVTVQPHWHGGLTSADGTRSTTPAGARVRVLPGPGGARHGSPDPLSGPPSVGDPVLDDVAAVVVDYTQGGVYHSPAYQDGLAEAARAAGALWVADEVVTGLGRTGTMLGFQHGNSRPDIVTMGKPLAGGMAPAGAVVVSRAVLEQLRGRSWQTYSTFRGHPAAIAAIRTTVRVVRDEGLHERAAAADPLVDERLRAIAARHPSVRRVDGRGLHWTVELHGPDWRTWTGASDQLPPAAALARRALELGVLIGTSGEPSSLFIAPPLVITDDELHELFDVLDAALDVADRTLEPTMA
jgi:4-aminobutyrate aminotransferase-like enzyme